MANSAVSVFTKPVAAFNRGDTFVFESWVCIADGAGSFQLLTPKIGVRKRLIFGPSLVGEHHSARGFPQSIQ
jgi:hypothetical protein